MADQPALPLGLSFVLVCPNQDALDIIQKIIEETTSVTPIGVRQSESATRFIMPPAASRNILNVAGRDMHRKLGAHVCAVSIPVDLPMEGALKAKKILQEGGLEVTIHPKAEPEFPEGFVVFVTSVDLVGFVLLFVPNKPPPQEIMRQLPPMTGWADWKSRNEP